MPSPIVVPVRVLLATAADCPALGSLDARAFLPTRLGRAMAGRADPDSVAAAFARRFERLLLDPKNVLLKAVRPAAGSRAGEKGAGGGERVGEEVIVGLAWYERPAPVGGVQESGSQLGNGEVVDRGWGPGTEEELMTGLWADLGEHARTITERHYHRPSVHPPARCECPADSTARHPVQSLGTNPEHQRTGAGGALVRWGIAQADAEGVAIYLDATEGSRLVTQSETKLRREG